MSRSNILQGTLDMLILKALAPSEPHGLGVSRRAGVRDCALGASPAVAVRAVIREGVLVCALGLPLGSEPRDRATR